MNIRDGWLVHTFEVAGSIWGSAVTCCDLSLEQGTCLLWARAVQPTSQAK